MLVSHFDASRPNSNWCVDIATQMAQVVAREFDIPISSVSVRSTNTLTNANGSVTGGSVTSELNCYVRREGAALPFRPINISLVAVCRPPWNRAPCWRRGCAPSKTRCPMLIGRRWSRPPSTPTLTWPPATSNRSLFTSDYPLPSWFWFRYRFSYAADEEVKGYIIHGATVTEVELDVLTGEKLVSIQSRISRQLERNGKLVVWEL